MGLVGLYYLFRPRFDRRAPLTYLYVVVVTLILLLVLLAGATWQRERYLFLMLPLLFLIAGEMLTRLLGLDSCLETPPPLAVGDPGPGSRPLCGADRRPQRLCRGMGL